MQKDSYTREEVIAADHEWPERGPLCPECGRRIPIFEDLSKSDERPVRLCISENNRVLAMQELRVATGCSLEWAKFWVQHGGVPNPAKETDQCPYCGMLLRTSLSKQCRFCLKDWHDEQNLVSLDSR